MYTNANISSAIMDGKWQYFGTGGDAGPTFLLPQACLIPFRCFDSIIINPMLLWCLLFWVEPHIFKGFLNITFSPICDTHSNTELIRVWVWGDWVIFMNLYEYKYLYIFNYQYISMQWFAAGWYDLGQRLSWGYVFFFLMRVSYPFFCSTKLIQKWIWGNWIMFMHWLLADMIWVEGSLGGKFTSPPLLSRCIKKTLCYWYHPPLLQEMQRNYFPPDCKN